MAIKDQCSKCVSYTGSICTISSSYPNFNQTSCEQYKKKELTLDKENNSIGGANISSSSSTNSINNQSGSNHTNSNIDYHSTITPNNKQSMFSNPFSFEGRIRRLEYGLSYLSVYPYAFLAGLVLGIIGIDSDVMIYICMIPAYWFVWAQGAKRCHDLGNSGWYQLIPFYFIWLLFREGDAGDNEYGPNPKS